MKKFIMIVGLLLLALEMVMGPAHATSNVKRQRSQCVQMGQAAVASSRGTYNDLVIKRSESSKLHFMRNDLCSSVVVAVAVALIVVLFVVAARVHRHQH